MSAAPPSLPNTLSNSVAGEFGSAVGRTAGFGPATASAALRSAGGAVCGLAPGAVLAADGAAAKDVC